MNPTASRLMIVVGLLAVVFGIWQVALNLPVERQQFDASQSGTSIFGGRDDLGNFVRTQSMNAQIQRENRERQGPRQLGTISLVLGTLLALAGVYYVVSGRRDTSVETATVSQAGNWGPGRWLIMPLSGVAGVVSGFVLLPPSFELISLLFGAPVGCIVAYLILRYRDSKRF